ncbi:MAG: ATP-binding protein [Acidobacteriota bacterium]
MLSSFNAPPPEVVEDGDLLQERIQTTASSLLSLLGIDADPIQSREAILLANILDHAWRAGEDLDLAALIGKLQKPPFEKIGVLPLDAFYPAKDRFELAMALNNLLASPSFQSWLSGDPLDIDRLLYTEEGKPRVAVFSIAHLADAERMFFVSLLLSQTLGWMRGRSGTSSLRALVYMDEIFGYLPPIGEPPSKKPLLTLLKQARAFGVGLVLATQNPVDLDYKALSNIGTWFLGRLQTERDKARVMDGLLSAGGELSKADLERLLSGLDKRVFLLHNVHEDGPVLYRVRWAMSYLCGPLTRRQIKTLMADRPAPEAAERPRRGAPVEAEAEVRKAAPRPAVPGDIEERFLPLAEAADDVLYRPAVVGAARVHFVNTRKGLEAEEEVLFLGEIDGGDLDWRDAELLDHLEDGDLERKGEEGARFGAVDAELLDPKAYRSWAKDFDDMLYRQRRWPLLQCESLKLIAEPGEGERDFKVRVAELAREKRDLEVEKLRDRYGKKVATLEDRIRRAEQRLEKEQEQASAQRMQSIINVGTTILGAFMGRKTFSKTNLRKATSAARGFGRSAKEGRDVDHAEQNLEALQVQLQELEHDFEDAVADLEARLDAETGEVTTFELKPRRSDVDVRLVGLVWRPYRIEDGVAEPAW